MVDSTSSSPPWWAAGLPFSCSQCGKCCESRGDVAHVYVGRADQERLASHLGLSLQVFRKRYTRFEPGGYLGLRFENGSCIFLDGKSCSVHEAKPVQCRTWPFWPELLQDPETYRKEVLEFCPGSQAETPIVPAESIAAQALATDEAIQD